MSSLEESDKAAAAVAVAPRVALVDITAAIREIHHFTAGAAIAALNQTPVSVQNPLNILSICIVVMNNGFTVIGKSAPASPENFDKALGSKFAYEDCVRQLWPLMGYALREKLANQ